MAHKSGLEEDFEKFSQFVKPGDAKREGRKVTLREDWDLVKWAIMWGVLEQKFEQNPDLMEKLLATGDAELIEENSWHDRVWGVCTCTECNSVGENNLGKFLMELREKNQSGD